ncbi:hypothetical protein SS50377_25493 [Spironucleus salmonicida]|uniref:Uncharacterized protein n=1 Tax=Spironucleus salmonicida TaxID=348837 RepID=V6LK88_9EUKA|nr:hypothetical protein SS50377_25493 [Spironucleus salmonicida]|eukprot:EST45040.1 Hypothetical protein SS50377_15059 [Spironucleus salmonicida]
MTEFASSLLHQNMDRYLAPHFYKQSNFEQITKQLINSFFAPQGYFYKVPNLLTSPPKSFIKESILFFSPSSQFHSQLILHQNYSSQHFTAPLADSTSYFHSIYAGCVSSSLFGDFIQLLIECSKNARFSVRSDNFELKSYRNGALQILENWSKWNGDDLNSQGLQCISTGNGVRKVVIVKSKEFVNILCIQTILNDIEICQCNQCRCVNQNIENMEIQECQQFQANLYSSNRNAILEIFLSSNKDNSDAMDYYMRQAAFYLLIQMQHFRHIVKLPIFLQLIKNMNLLMKNNVGNQIFSLFFEQITAFLENYIYRLKRAYAVSNNGKQKFDTPDKVYFKINTMIISSLDQILLFINEWRLILNYEAFQKVYASKNELLECILSFQSIVKGTQVNIIYQNLYKSKSIDDFREEDIWVNAQKVSHRIQQLFDNTVTQVHINTTNVRTLYKKASNLGELKSFYISSIIQLIKPSVQHIEEKIQQKRYLNFFGIMQIDYDVLNKFFGSQPPEMREAKNLRYSNYNNRLLASGIENTPKYKLSQPTLTENWLVIADALKSQVFWILVLIAAFVISFIKHFTLWILQ